MPVEPLKDLKCYKCEYLIPKIIYYTEIDRRFCELELEREKEISSGKVCPICGKVESMNFSGIEYVKLKEKNGSKFCQKCLSERIKSETSDPSNGIEKYRFDEKSLKWILNKVYKACVDCGKKRWLNAENQWKSRCSNCYSRERK